MNFGLVFAWGPTPKDPVDARLLGAEEERLADRCREEASAFRMYIHRAALPELVALVRSLGRDCTYEPFAERQALLHVAGAA